MNNRFQAADRLVMRFKDGTTAVLRIGDGCWECERDPHFERILNAEWRLRDSRDTLEALAERLNQALRGQASLEVRRD